jgi:hypothetical protein
MMLLDLFGEGSRLAVGVEVTVVECICGEMYPKTLSGKIQL